ncbi:hypothetical protein [Flavimarina sp. Hel_I_48]|uniref:hypothetical protein n=1 Tax=Flavimarina sp. Hel_I_48 TaxID=1392488 RepID=UPI001F133EED|nr:hypothetical protein [Flavimarina sp. Hel_I_48]
MHINYLRVFLVCIFSVAFANAQTTDIARVEYMHIPFAKSKNSLSRYRALLQIPVPLDKERNHILVLGLEYRFIDITIKDSVPFDPLQVNSVERMELALGYVFKIAGNWRLGIRTAARISSTLNQSAHGDDYIYNAAVYAINNVSNPKDGKPYRLIFGLNYSTTPGRNYPLPLIDYSKRFRPNWDFTLGVPKTSVRHYLNESHKDAFQAFATLDNFFGNLQRPITIDGKTAENISMTIVLGGLGYEHFFTKKLRFFAYAAHSVSNDFRLRNNDRDDIYTINDDNSFYFRGGMKFKF